MKYTERRLNDSTAHGGGARQQLGELVGDRRLPASLEPFRPGPNRANPC